MVSSALGLTYTTPKMYNRRYGRETSQVQFVLFYNFYNYGYKRANGRDAESGDGGEGYLGNAEDGK